MKRALLLGGIALALVVVIGIVLAGRDETTAPPNTSVTFGKGHAEGRRIATRSWSCDYDKIVANDDQSLLEVEGVRNGVIYREGKPYLHLTAQHMSANMLTHDFTAHGKLHVESADPKKRRAFETDTLTWNEGAQTLSVTSPLTLYTDSGEPLRIDSLVFDVRAETLHLGKTEGSVNL